MWFNLYKFLRGREVLSRYSFWCTRVLEAKTTNERISYLQKSGWLQISERRWVWTDRLGTTKQAWGRAQRIEPRQRLLLTEQPRYRIFRAGRLVHLSQPLTQVFDMKRGHDEDVFQLAKKVMNAYLRDRSTEDQWKTRARASWSTDKPLIAYPRRQTWTPLFRRKHLRWRPMSDCDNYGPLKTVFY